MRKGYLLVQLLVVFVCISVLSVLLGTMYVKVFQDIPRSNRIIQTNTKVLNMLKCIQEDVDNAAALPESFKGYTSDDKRLLIELTDEMIVYELTDTEVVRSRFNKGGKSERMDSMEWAVEGARLEWKVWRKDGVGYAVELKKYIEKNDHGHITRKMENSHLYFAGGFREATKKK